MQDNVAWHMKGRTQAGHVTQQGAVAHNVESRDLCSNSMMWEGRVSHGRGGGIEIPSVFGGET